MVRTYTIRKGQQYDSDGASVRWAGSARYGANGTRHSGDLVPSADVEVVEAAVQRVIATGQSETVTCGEPETPNPAARQILADHEALMRQMDRAESDY